MFLSLSRSYVLHAICPVCCENMYQTRDPFFFSYSSSFSPSSLHAKNIKAISLSVFSPQYVEMIVNDDVANDDNDDDDGEEELKG